MSSYSASEDVSLDDEELEAEYKRTPDSFLDEYSFSVGMLDVLNDESIMSKAVHFNAINGSYMDDRAKSVFKRLKGLDAVKGAIRKTSKTKNTENTDQKKMIQEALRITAMVLMDISNQL